MDLSIVIQALKIFTRLRYFRIAAVLSVAQAQTINCSRTFKLFTLQMQSEIKPVNSKKLNVCLGGRTGDGNEKSQNKVAPK